MLLVFNISPATSEQLSILLNNFRSERLRGIALSFSSGYPHDSRDHLRMHKVGRRFQLFANRRRINFAVQKKLIYQTNQQLSGMSVHTILDPADSFRVPPNSCALGIMTKAPIAGTVKTRLVPPFTSEEAAELNKCFLRDISTSISACCAMTFRFSCVSKAYGVGIYTPVGAEGTFERILPPDFFLLPQRDRDFGQRLFSATTDLFAVGFESVCLINSDSPTVPAKNFFQAVQFLCSPDDVAVLGPCQDGGYYLIGLKQPHRQLFEQIDWSTDRVLDQTSARAAAIGLKVKVLSIADDVDDQPALQRLCEDLFSGNHQHDGTAPHTQRFLSDLIKREGRERIWHSTRK